MGDKLNTKLGKILRFPLIIIGWVIFPVYIALSIWCIFWFSDEAHRLIHDKW